MSGFLKVWDVLGTGVRGALFLKQLCSLILVVFFVCVFYAWILLACFAFRL